MGDTAVSIELQRLGSDFKLVLRVDLDVAVEVKNVGLTLVDRARGGDLIGSFTFGRLNGHVDVFQLVMTV